MTNTSFHNAHDTTDCGDIPGTDPTSPYVLQRDEGDHLHFLDNLATRKVTAGAGGSMTVVEFVAPRGFGPPLHVHADEDEVMIILDGEIAFRTGDQEIIGRPGATVFLPHGVPHSFQVLTETARTTSITASRSGHAPRFDLMVAALGEATEEATLPAPMDIDPGRVAEVCGAHGIEVLGPPPSPLS